MKSKIYTEILKKLGWFDAGEFKPLQFVHQVYPKETDISRKVIGYFPGCFAEFHLGHHSVIRRFAQYVREHLKAEPLVVISPANSDYTFSKYGDVDQATNKYRFDRIHSFSSCLDHSIGSGSWCVDLNPMLNFEHDANFTDLLEHFLNRYQSSLDTIKETPYIICGKDRDFRLLEKVTDKIKVFYSEDVTSQSSSSIIKDNPRPRKKKHLILRCKSKDELKTFKDFWNDQYEKIDPLFVSEEIHLVENRSKQFDATCCKDYKGLLPYVHVSRRWENPLLQAEHWTDGHLYGLNILDSDIYSGSTQKFVESKGGSLEALFDFSGQTDEIEVLDFADFLKTEFVYPFTDISSRCSMQAFDKNMHFRYACFREEIGSEK